VSDAVLIAEGGESQPWGDKPPPLPVGSTRKDTQQIVTAWKFWGDVRPTYIKDGGEVVCTVELDGRTWSGRASISDPVDHSTSAWLALHNCIAAWLDDTNLLRSLRKRFRR
jgi:hypothetical protein